MRFDRAAPCDATALEATLTDFFLVLWRTCFALRIRWGRSGCGDLGGGICGGRVKLQVDDGGSE